jgi:2-polyprenyl-3-methyl-5-hydroxy-6-metoxy-1,4-benzoquinol methylase
MNSEKLQAFIKSCAETHYDETRSDASDAVCRIAADNLSGQLQPGATVLDIGCGNGQASKRLRELGHNPVALSVSEKECAALRADGLDAVQLDMHDIEPSALGKTFAGVVARHVLEHSPIPLYVLRCIAEVTAEKGWLYVEVPAPETICKHETNANHYSVFGLTAWGQLIDRAGFKVMKHGTLPLLTGIGPDVYFWFLAQKT